MLQAYNLSCLTNRMSIADVCVEKVTAEERTCISEEFVVGNSMVKRIVLCLPSI